MMTDEERCQRYVRLLNKYTDLKWSFGYLGNDYGSDTSERCYYVFASHPGRVGTYRDRMGGVDKPADLIPMLQGAVELAIVQSFRKEESKGLTMSEAELLDTPNERVGQGRVAVYMAEHRDGLHSCRETDACMCLNCQIRWNDWAVSYAILTSNCPLCRLDLMNGVPAGNDFPAKF